MPENHLVHSTPEYEAGCWWRAPGDLGYISAPPTRGTDTSPALTGVKGDLDPWTGLKSGVLRDEAPWCLSGAR